MAARSAVGGRSGGKKIRASIANRSHRPRSCCVVIAPTSSRMPAMVMSPWRVARRNPTLGERARVQVARPT